MRKKPKQLSNSDSEQSHDQAVDGAQQPLLAHLADLRRSLLRSLIGLLVAFLALFPFANHLYAIVSAPLRAKLPADMTMIAIDVATPFLTPLKLCAYLALILAMPYILHQLWRFIAPGLYLREKKLAIPLLVSSVLLFYAGILFAYFLVFPLVFNFFQLVMPEGISWMTDINSYLNFVTTMVLAFGLVFEIPIATMLLVLAGITTPQNVAKKRPYVVVGCFFIGMMLTPPDVISQVLLAVPAWLLFELGILLSRVVIRRRKAAE